MRINIEHTKSIPIEFDIGIQIKIFLFSKQESRGILTKWGWSGSSKARSNRTKKKTSSSYLQDLVLEIPSWSDTELVHSLLYRWKLVVVAQPAARYHLRNSKFCEARFILFFAHGLVKVPRHYTSRSTWSKRCLVKYLRITTATSSSDSNSPGSKSNWIWHVLMPCLKKAN